MHATIGTWMYTWYYHRLSSSEFSYVLTVIVFVMYQLLLYYIMLLPSFYTRWEFSNSPEFAYPSLRYFFCSLGNLGSHILWGAYEAMVGVQSSFLNHPFLVVPLSLFEWFSLYWTRPLFYLIVHKIILCENLYVILHWLYGFHSWFIYLSQVTLSLACIRGIFSSRICVTDSRHVSFLWILGSRAWQKGALLLMIVCFLGAIDAKGDAFLGRFGWKRWRPRL